MRIGVDIDNTVGKYLQEFCLVANKMFGTKLTIDDMTSEKVRFEELGLLTEEQVRLVKKADKQNKTFEKMPVYEDAVSALKQITAEHEVYFISSRNNYEHDLMLSHTRTWLNNNGIHKYKEIIFSSDKPKVSRELEVDYFVEDNLHEVLNLRGVVKKSYLLTRPWNKQAALPADIIRVSNWGDVLKELNYE